MVYLLGHSRGFLKNLNKFKLNFIVTFVLILIYLIVWCDYLIFNITCLILIELLIVCDLIICPPN